MDLSKIMAGYRYVMANRTEIKEAAKKVAAKIQEVAIRISRVLVDAYYQGAVVALLTWTNRVDVSFLQALKQAIAEVRTMKGDEVANYAIAIFAPQVQA